jgi:peroxiredoxin
MKRVLAALCLLAAGAFPAVAAGNPVAALSLMKPNPVRPAKNFQVTTPEDRPLSLADFRGKVVLLNFWATWCKPCEEEMPGMERLYRRYKDRGLVVLAVASDAEGARAVTPFVKRLHLSFPVGLDPTMSAAALYGVWALPSTFVIDRQGNRAFFANGARDWGGPAARALVDSLLR